MSLHGKPPAAFLFAYHGAAWAHNEISWEPNAINWSVNVVRVTCIPFIFARYSNVLVTHAFTRSHQIASTCSRCVDASVLLHLNNSTFKVGLRDFSSTKSANDFVTFTLYYPIKCLSTTSHLQRLIVGSCIANAAKNIENCDISLLMAFSGRQTFQTLAIKQTQLSQKFY